MVNSLLPEGTEGKNHAAAVVTTIMKLEEEVMVRWFIDAWVGCHLSQTELL